MISIQTLIFDAFALIAVFSAVMVVLSNNPVRSALALVLAFFAMSVIWIFAQAEFLALILILVYVGAVMTLFLFVIMMLNIDVVSHKWRFVRYVPLAALVVGALMIMMIHVMGPESFSTTVSASLYPASYSNTEDLGQVLYTNYVLAFELAAVLLLVAIIAAISLVHQKSRTPKTQEPRRQIQVRAEERVRLIKDLRE